jgi:probable addiction module antidote protein
VQPHFGGDDRVCKAVSANGEVTRAKTRPFDAAEYLDSPEMIAEYLTEAFETDDAAFIAKAIGTVARAQGMGAVAESAGSRSRGRREARTIRQNAIELRPGTRPKP